MLRQNTTARPWASFIPIRATMCLTSRAQTSEDPAPTGQKFARWQGH
jgi:hypothetical protein